MDAEAADGRNYHDQVVIGGGLNTLEWIYHKLHICMCVKQPKTILKSQWPITPLAWFSYRTAIAVYIDLMLITYFTNTVLFYLDQDFIVAVSHIAEFYIDLSNWGLILLTISFNFKAYVVLKYFHFLTSDVELTSQPVSFILLLFFNNLSNATAFGVSFIYWVVLYRGPPILGIFRINVCVMNSVISLLDVFLSEIPVHFAHFYQPLLVGLAYAIFTYMYHISGGSNLNADTWVYPKFIWVNISAKTIFFIMVLGCVLFIVLHALVILISWTRGRIAVRAERRAHPA
uniref:Uncharacterized protein n=1 Tax=Strigamia maritima TaxID=126957 RepID=T1J7W5_STRMM